MEKRVTLGLNFELKLVPVVNSTNKISGVLYYKGELVDTAIELYFPTNSSAIRYYNNNVIPKYIFEKNIRHYLYLQNSEVIKLFVKKYLTDNKITYGSVLDVIKVIDREGYAPGPSDISNLSDASIYLKTVDKISSEFKRQLTAFGYGADRNPDNSYDHEKSIKYAKCKNLVYTRFPWTPGYKVNKAVTSTLKSLTHDYIGKQDMSVFQKKHSELYKTMTAVLNNVSELGADLDNTLTTTKYYELFNNFDQLVDIDKDKLIAKWKTLTPVNYGKFID